MLRPDEASEGNSVAHRRCFTIADAAILIAATALGLGFVRRDWVDPVDRWLALAWEGKWERMAYAASTGSAWMLAAFLVPWTAAILLPRIRTPRRSRPILSREPGVIGCIVAAIMATIQAAYLRSADWLHERGLYWGGEMPIRIADLSGPGVAGAWLARALTGTDRGDDGWIDGLSKALGMARIAGFALSQFP